MFDFKWVSNLMFFADFCEHLNFKLQGGGKTLHVTFGYIKAFEKKIEIFKKDIGDEKFKYFSNLKSQFIDLQTDDKTGLQSLKKLFLNGSYK